MKPPVLLCYNLPADQNRGVRLTAMRFGVRIRTVQPQEYAEPLAALCGFEPLTNAAFEGEPFTDEMLVMASFPPELMSAFLQGLRHAKVRAIPLKAMLTETNAAWTSPMLRDELSKEAAAMQAHQASVHAEPKA